MSTKHFSEGSLWRRWDLHIHVPETKLSDGYTCDGDVWDEYIDQLEKSPVQVFGITDYFSSDGYFALVDKYNEKYPDTDKVFFPNVEFRLTATNRRSSTISSKRTVCSRSNSKDSGFGSPTNSGCDWP